MPIAFTLLLTLMLLSWSQAAFFGFSEDSNMSLNEKDTTKKFVWTKLIKGNKVSLQEKYEILNEFVFILSILALTVLIVIRWIESGHFPLSNLYESLLFLAWCFLSLKIVFQSESKSSFSQLGLNVILSPLALLIFGFAFLSLPKEMQQSTSLVPALQSNWLMMHVTVMVLSYAALISGSILSIAFLILNRFISFSAPMTFEQGHAERASKDINESSMPLAFVQGYTQRALAFLLKAFQPSTLFLQPINEMSNSITMVPNITNNASGRSPDANMVSTKQKPSAFQKRQLLYQTLSLRLDNLSYRILALGFPLLTIGILSGAVWANEAWGSYWSWDPKETWALITWLVFAIYLHARITKGWSGEKPAIVASVGFCMVWFCYLGVNLLGNGLHSYGWFAS